MNVTGIHKSDIIPYSVNTNNLKLKHFEMSMDDQKLYIKLSAPFLNSFNHWCVLTNNTLKIKANPTNSVLKTSDETLEIPVHIPNKGYTKISKRFFEDQTLHVELEKSNSAVLNT